MKSRINSISSENKIRNFGAGRLGLAQWWLFLIIIAVGALGAFMLVKFKRPPQRIESEVLVPLVESAVVEVRDIRMLVTGYGSGSPKVMVDIVPEVTGRVVSIHPQLNAGGFVRAGEQLLKIDPRDYELAVQQAQAAVAEAIVQLDLEKAEAQVAREEWRQLNPDTQPSSPLVFREPQIRQAQAKLESAKAGLAFAQLALERTSLTLPIDVRIVSETVDLGQHLVSGRAIGSAYGIEAVEIELPLDDSELAWFDIPDATVSFNGRAVMKDKTAAIVKADFGGTVHTWQGHVARTVAEVDKTSRLISVVIEVPDPFDTSGGRPPLLPGIFAEVIIEGHILKNALAIPRDAVHNGNEVWVVNNDRLHIKKLDIIRSDKDFAYVVSGLEDSSVIVLSSLDVVSEGMRVRLDGETEEVTDANSINSDSGEAM